ncbi:TetR family transcriptional regulator [Rhodococcus sp. 15-1154-1]|nr:TetR/AcrR family transcriptional regulator [Rhodococcus sp. 15-1154-1]OZF09439.1 TetR family transcriptional regulator [Rhodococcus sp. 15-1154-1]
MTAATKGKPATATARPGGRTALVRRAVLAATEDALIEYGFAGVELPAVADAAKVGKTTVYRRWGSPQALVSDLLDDMAARSVSATRTGDFTADLSANAELVVKTLTDHRTGRLFSALIAASTHDADTKQALADFYRTRVSEWAAAVTDAVERGDLPSDTDAAEVVRYLSAPLYYQFLTTTKPLDAADADRAVRATAAAARAGVFGGREQDTRGNS